MIRGTTQAIELARIAGIPSFVDGAYQFGALRVIASNVGGWDHVSVSREDRTPTWDEMEQIKRRFFLPDEAAMQLHVPVSDHVNLHPNCLHLWRPQTTEEIALIGSPFGPRWAKRFPMKSPGVIPLPPVVFV